MTKAFYAALGYVLATGGAVALLYFTYIMWGVAVATLSGDPPPSGDASTFADLLDPIESP